MDSFELVYDEKEKVWKQKRAPLVTIEIHSEKEYNFVQAALEFYTHRHEYLKLPEGKAGDILEWDPGAGLPHLFKRIQAIMICADSVRYDLGSIAPVVDHENIIRIMSEAEARERMADGDA